MWWYKCKSNRTVVAISYDFDGTLAPSNMLEQVVFPRLGIKKDDFWDVCKKYAEDHHMDELLAYMHLLLEKGNDKMTRSFLDDCGKNLNFFSGVESWFDRINQFARSKKINLEHYVISSGLQRIIKNCAIARHFNYVWACDFLYDTYQKPLWPSLVVNYTTKTQYLFRINKGVHEPWKNNINEFTPDHKRSVPFSNMIFIGDGATDVPSMKMTIHKGGRSIAVYDPSQERLEETCKNLRLQGRVTDYAPADYTQGSRLDKVIKDILIHISKHYSN